MKGRLVMQWVSSGLYRTVRYGQVCYRCAGKGRNGEPLPTVVTLSIPLGKDAAVRYD
jgi:hypothetical protein